MKREAIRLLIGWWLLSFMLFVVVELLMIARDWISPTVSDHAVLMLFCIFAVLLVDSFMPTVMSWTQDPRRD